MPDTKKLPSRLSRSPRLIVALGLFGVSGWLLAGRDRVDTPDKTTAKSAPQGTGLPSSAADARPLKSSAPASKL
jgi:hypothetical protein